MQIDLAALPNNPVILQQMLRDLVAAAAQEQVALQGAVQEREAENDKLRLLIQRLLRHRFGRRSEQLSPDQLQFGLEDLEQTIAEGEAAQEAAAQSDQQRQKRRTARPQRNHGALPAHLPRE
jgi:transposase